MTVHRLVLVAAAVASLATPAAWAQAEEPMTPTPTPAATPSPAVSPIPMYPEPAPEVRTPVTPDVASQGVRIDSPGMFGAGFMIGNTSTGANGKLWFHRDVAVQFSAGSGPLGNNVRFQLDLLYVFHRVEGEEAKYSLPFYAGLGGQAGIYFKHPWPDDRTDVGIRIPVGMSVVIPDNPVEIYFEVAPDVAVYHDDFDDEDHAVFFVDGQIGVRYYF